MVAPIWNSEIDWLGHARRATQHLRDSDQRVIRIIRRGLLAQDLDPANTIVAEFYGDGGSDYGVLIDPDGVVRTLNRPWGTETVELTTLTRDPYPSDALHLYGAWMLFNEEGRGPKDPIAALLPYIKWRTREFRSRERKQYGRQVAYDWSLPYGLLSEIGADPLSTLVMHPTVDINPHPHSMGYGFLVPDGRVFVLAAVRDADRNPVSVLEWEEIAPGEIEETCGPLYEAAVRVQAQERH